MVNRGSLFMERFEKMKTQLLILGLIELVVLIVAQLLLKPYLNTIQYGIILVNILLIFMIFTFSARSYRERVVHVSRVLGKESGEAFSFGRLAILTYDDKRNITWMSEVFDDYGLNRIGEPLTTVFPQLAPTMANINLEVFVDINSVRFKAKHLSAKGVIAFQEQTELGRLHQELQDSSVVLGFAYLDNYEETTAYEDEQTIATMDTNIREAVVHWADTNHLMIRRLRPDRYLLLLNEKIFSDIEKDNFSILNTVRTEASKIDASITLSLAFARKSDNYKELEEMANAALELAQSRGGDQVAINEKGEKTRYFGGTVEAVEKRSKVRVRVTAQNLGEMISKSRNVIIVGHRMMDFDCMGSALGVAAIAKSYHKTATIVLDVKDIEAKLSETLEKYTQRFTDEFSFVTPSEALESLKESTLVVMVDHHNEAQTQVPEIIEKAQQIVVIDHHRRMGEFTFKPKLVYIEPSASSASELVVELFPYHKEKITVSPFASTIMYTGILIDTNRFRNRTGSRTFEAMAELRKFGSSLSQVEDFLRDEYEDFELKNKVLNQSELYDNGFVIATYKDGFLKRALMSQVADDILKVRNVEATFVVSNVNEDTVGISSRSKGDVNVQRVMEILGGGGHFTAAAAQIKNSSINEVVENLKNAIETVRKEVN